MNEKKPARATIAAVAARAGVSPSAVSHVFNGRRNVSAATEARIRRAADELHWRPNYASRKVSGRGGRSLGLVVTRSGDTFERDPFFMRLIAGLTEPLAEIGWSLSLTLVQAADEQRVYRDWWSEQRVDAFLLVDVREADPRIGHLRELGAPAVLLGSPIDAAVPAVTVQDDAAYEEVLDHLASLGHHAIARVSDSPGLLHSRDRDRRFITAAQRHDMTPMILHWAPEDRDPVADILRRAGTTTALLVDSEAMAAEIIAHAPELGVLVPEQLSVIAWEDSWVSTLVRPRITALDAPVEESARTAVKLLAQLVNGEDAVSQTVSPRRLIVRESTAHAPVTETTADREGRQTRD
ncbi:LacI family DNA-binding transcriptional regulator [Microbacterium sp. ISL-108]|nr:LacI family DNA-binding transcriptional regulator [Microbacterium sp. ISL-108]MBT2486831.1 LacI family DNA-binding transcriptional regulator [Microbacterium sp. ISL-108]RKN64753.1 LacI family transcriptional regulator [Microbacterium sp. CGR2]